MKSILALLGGAGDLGNLIAHFQDFPSVFQFSPLIPMPAPQSAPEQNLGCAIPEPLKDTFLPADLLLCGLKHQLCPECLINCSSSLSSLAPQILQAFLVLFGSLCLYGFMPFNS